MVSAVDNAAVSLDVTFGAAAAGRCCVEVSARPDGTKAYSVWVPDAARVVCLGALLPASVFRELRRRIPAPRRSKRGK